MRDTNTSENLKSVNSDEKKIQILYDDIMQSFEGTSVALTSDLMVDGYYQMLYAPGYEEIGVGEIVAQCK